MGFSLNKEIFNAPKFANLKLNRKFYRSTYNTAVRISKIGFRGKLKRIFVAFP